MHAYVMQPPTQKFIDFSMFHFDQSLREKYIYIYIFKRLVLVKLMDTLFLGHAILPQKFTLSNLLFYRLACLLIESNIYIDLVEPVERVRKEQAY